MAAQPLQPRQSDRVVLRPTVVADLETLFEFHADPDAAAMAVMIPRDRPAFMKHWLAIIADPTVTLRSIVADDVLTGSISCFGMEGKHWIGYWIGRPHWSRGIATSAVRQLVREVPIRPIHARAARTNTGSIRVLERAGFSLMGYVHAPAEGQFPACEEAVFELR